MNSDMEMIRCSIMRGGTSKGVFFLENDLPKDQELRDKVIQAAFGGVDVRQIDGLGGADTLTSKVAIVGPSTREGCDVDYTFGQVSFVAPLVDYKGNCGNISAAVGTFAVDNGLVAPVEPITTVRIHLTNTDNIIVAEVPVKSGRASAEGDYSIAGVPGTGVKITLDFSDTQGAISGRLQPTGNPVDVLDFGGLGSYEVSIVDAGNPLVFIAASSLGLKGTETPAEIESDTKLMETIEMIRAKTAFMIHLVDSEQYSVAQSPYIPFFSIVSPATDYTCYNGKVVTKEEVDLVARLLFMQKMHKTYPGTGTVCTGAAARIPNSVVWKQLSKEARERMLVRIGHPAGVIEVEASAESKDDKITITRAAFDRTARKIMDGYVYIKKSVFS